MSNVPHRGAIRSGTEADRNFQALVAKLRGKSPLFHADRHRYDGEDSLSAADLLEPLDVLRSSECATFPRQLAQSSSNLTTAWCLGGRAVARSAFTATKMRFCVVTAFANLTDFRLVVWDGSSRVVLANTGDMDASVNGVAAGTVIEGTLSASLAVTKGAQYYLGMCGVGQTAGAIRTFNTGQGVAALSPKLALLSATYVGGTPPTIGNFDTGVVPWVELLA